MKSTRRTIRRTAPIAGDILLRRPPDKSTTTPVNCLWCLATHGYTPIQPYAVGIAGHEDWLKMVMQLNFRRPERHSEVPPTRGLPVALAVHGHRGSRPLARQHRTSRRMLVRIPGGVVSVALRRTAHPHRVAAAAPPKNPRAVPGS